MSDELGTIYVTSKNGLNIRNEPKIDGQKVGVLPYKEERMFIDSAKDEIGNLWVKLLSLRDEWVCVEYRGQELAMVSVAPPCITEPEPPTLVWSVDDLNALMGRVEVLEEEVKKIKQIAGIG